MKRPDAKSLLQLHCVALVLGVSILACTVSTQTPKAPAESAWGIWKADGAEEWLEITPQRIFRKRGKRLHYIPIHSRHGVSWEVVNEGLAETWTLEPSSDGGLLITIPGESAKQFRRAPAAPASDFFSPSKYVLKPPGTAPLGEARVKAIQEEFERRVRVEQAAIRADDGAAKEAALADNLKYLFDLVAELGWIDSSRFGGRAAHRAALFVHHSQDLGLMLSALPLVEADAKASGDVGLLDLYGLMVDRTRLHLGEKQVYGSQVNEGSDGNPVVLALADPCRVDERRLEIKQPPLAEYVKRLSEMLYDGKPYRVPDLEAAQARGECAAQPAVKP